MIPTSMSLFPTQQPHHQPNNSISVFHTKMALLVGAIFLLIIMYDFSYPNNEINFLVTGDWSHFPGATVTKHGIHITPLGRMIIHQDGSKGQPNPPVNVAQHLLVKGNFNVVASLLQIDKQASIRFYGNPPMVYDQWRYETPGIEVLVDLVKNSITARIWDGNSNTSMDIRTYSLSLKPDMIISLEHIKPHINIIADGHLLGSMPDHNIFDSGKIWFGADGMPNSNGWTLGALLVKPLGRGTVKIAPELLPVTAQNNISTKIKIGTAINTDLLFTDTQYRNLALSQFNIFTPENNLKPQFVQPTPGIYDFAQTDQLIDIALKNNIAIHGHALVYIKSTPEWMVKSPKGTLQKVMTDHITDVVRHYKGRIAQWDVVNEPFSQKHALYGFGKTGLDENIWFEAMGEKYIDLAFQSARRADPNAKLYLNDYGMENDGQRWDALLNLVKRLKQRGVPIDGVGFEGHIYTDGDYVKKDQLKKHMEELDKLGLLVRISEIDVTGDNASEQVKQYVLALDVCLGAPNCTSYSTWGITDKYGSTTRSDRYPLVYGTSLLWDKEMKPKPAYHELQKRLLYPYGTSPEGRQKD